MCPSKLADGEERGRDEQVMGEIDRHDSNSLARRDLLDFERVARPPRHLLRDDLAAHARPPPMGEHDGADHGDEEDDARRLEQVEVVGVEDLPQGVRVGELAAGRQRRDALGGGGGQQAPTTDDDDDLRQEHEADEATDRQIDALVYELYGLTEEEIGIVEGRG